MSQKQVKKYARVIRRNKDKIFMEFIHHIRQCGFFDRLAFAWFIIIARPDKGAKK